MKTIILTGNTTWVLEATLNLVKGVQNIIPGQYHLKGYDFCKNPKEYLFALKIVIDESQLSLDDFLAVFYNVHSPFLNPWNNDDCFYPMCRSALFVNEEDDIKSLIETKINTLNMQKLFDMPIDTKVEIVNLSNFKADPKANIDFYKRFKEDGLSISIIEPRINKLQEKLPHLLNN